MKKPRYNLPPFNLACEGCGTGLWCGERFGGRYAPAVWCHTCYQRLWREKQRKLHLRHKQCTCVTCGIEFTTTRTDAKFCSNACRQKAHRRAQAADTALKTTATARRVR